MKYVVFVMIIVGVICQVASIILEKRYKNKMNDISSQRNSSDN